MYSFRLTNKAWSLWAVLGLASCRNQHIVYEGYYKDQPILLKSIEQKGPSTNAITYSLQLGNLPSLQINALTTDLRGIPYSDSIFGQQPRYYWDSTKVYDNQLSSEQPVSSSILYVSETSHSRDEFERYAAFFLDEWQQIETNINKDYPYLKPHLIGMVYGDKDKFTSVFTSDHGDGRMILKVYPDGRVTYTADDKWKQERYSGLSPVIQMPGKILYLDGNIQNGGLSREQIAQFKDKEGRDPEKYFTLLSAP